MFKIIEKPTFLREVEVNVPADGGFEQQTLKVRFNVVPVSEINEFEPLSAGENQLRFCQRIVDTFSDIVDHNGAQVQVTDEIRSRLLDLTYVRTAVMRDYTLAMMGAKEKN